MQKNGVVENPAAAEDGDGRATRHGLIPLTRWAKEIGRTTSTLWRWRNLGWITVVNVYGKNYIAEAEIERFNARAAAGEFAKKAVVPLRTKEIGA